MSRPVVTVIAISFVIMSLDLGKVNTMIQSLTRSTIMTTLTDEALYGCDEDNSRAQDQ